jgi:hypothetical protein
MRTLVSAIITGFGIKLGTDIYKYVKNKVGFFADIKDGDPSVEQTAGAEAT